MERLDQKKTSRGGPRWWEFVMWAKSVDAGRLTDYPPTIGDLAAYEQRLHEV